MGRRYSRLEFAKRSLLKGDGTGTPVDPGKDSVLGKYIAYKSGAVAIVRDKTKIAKPGKSITVGLLAFSFPVASNKKLVYVTGRYATLPTAKSTLELIDSGDLSLYIEQANFVPAKVHLGLKLGTGATPETSKITGIPYVPRVSDTWSVPFGNSATPKTYSERVATILNAFAETHTVSFDNEMIRRG